MPPITHLDAVRSFVSTHGASRARHLRNVSHRLDAISGSLAERGFTGASEKLALTASRVETRGTKLEALVQRYSPGSLPPVIADGEAIVPGASGGDKGRMIDVTA